MTPTPPGGTPATPDGPPPRNAVPPPRNGFEPLPRRVRGASGVTEAGADPEPVAEDTLQRLLSGLRDI